MKHTDPEYIKDIYKEVRFELKQKTGKEVSWEEVEDTVRTYIKLLVKLMGRGERLRPESFIDRMQLPFVGYIYFKRANYSYLLKPSNKLTKLLKEEGRQAYHKFRDRGWIFIRWNHKLGYIFKRNKEDVFYFLKSPDITNTWEAFIGFNIILDNKYENTNCEVIFKPKFTPVDVKIGRIVAYSYQGVKKKYYENISEVMKYSGLKGSSILNIVISNSESETSLIPIRGEVLFFEGKEKLNKLNILLSSLRNWYIVDIIDGTSGEVLYEKYGTPTDVRVLLQDFFPDKIIRTSEILRVIDTNKRMYGYRFKKSVH